MLERGTEMGVREMTGSPWHAEKVHRAQGDDRRYKGRCKFYQYQKDYCSKRVGRCMGSAHCDQYQAMSENEFIRQQKLRQNKLNAGDDDCYWY